MRNRREWTKWRRIVYMMIIVSCWLWYRVGYYEIHYMYSWSDDIFIMEKWEEDKPFWGWYDEWLIYPMERRIRTAVAFIASIITICFFVHVFYYKRIEWFVRRDERLERIKRYEEEDRLREKAALERLAIKEEEAKVAGSYEYKSKIGNTFREVFLVNGDYELYMNGKKSEDKAKWEIVRWRWQESVRWTIHVVYEDGSRTVSKINEDGSITAISASAGDGKYRNLPKEEQLTYKKIK